MKRTKNSRIMHMLFNVQYGTVEVKVHENEFTVHKGGIWQVPRGTLFFFLPRTAVSFIPRRFLYGFSCACTTAVTLCSQPVGIQPVAPASWYTPLLMPCNVVPPGAEASERLLFLPPAVLWRQHAWHACRACSVTTDAIDGSQAVIPCVHVNRCATQRSILHSRSHLPEDTFKWAQHQIMYSMR